ncbi:MAG: hypothetical protein QM655_00030 [Nocardioidaceae bacterium]
MPESFLFTRLLDVHHHLDAAGIDHAVGGAIALGFHVREPRTTNDIDLNVSVPAAEGSRLFAALPAELVIPADARSRLAREGWVRLRYADPEIPLDLFTPQHPTFHALITARAEPFDGLDGLKILTATDVVILKALFNRSKDWPDIESLLEAGTADLDEAVAWLGEILGPGSPEEQRLRALAAKTGPQGEGDRPARIDWNRIARQ